MKTLSLVSLLLPGMMFVLLGCSDASTPLVSHSDAVASSGTAQASLGKGAVVRSVTASGNIWIEGKMGVLTINARLYADGTVDGIFNLVNTAFNPKAQWLGRIVALTFYENYTFSNDLSGRTVLIWCRLDKGGLDHDLGYWATFVVDNGQVNGGAAQDWVGPTSDIYPNVINLTPQQVADQYPFFFVPVDVGSVVIH
jgi:hypothetical protein